MRESSRTPETETMSRMVFLATTETVAPRTTTVSACGRAANRDAPTNIAAAAIAATNNQMGRGGRFLEEAAVEAKIGSVFGISPPFSNKG